MAGHNATFIKLLINDTELVGEISNGISSTVDDIDLSSKKTGRQSDGLPGRISENISFESLADDTSADYGYALAKAAMDDGTLLPIKIIRTDEAGAQVSGSEITTCSGYITSLTLDNPDNDRSSMSGTIEIDGDTIVGTYTPA